MAPVAHAMRRDGACSPFEVNSASGSLYAFAQAGSVNDATTVPVNLVPLLTGGLSSSASAGLPKAPTNGVAHNVITLTHEGLLSVECEATGHAQANGTSAFARSDISATVLLTLPATRRVQGSWQVHGSGISDLTIMLRRMDPWITAVDAAVFTYIKPQSASGSVQLVLPADGYQLVVYGSLQANTGFMNPDNGAYGGSLSLSCAPLADVDFDGAVTAADLAALLAAWGAVPPFHAADLNQDGTVDSTDLALLLADW